MNKRMISFFFLLALLCGLFAGCDASGGAVSSGGSGARPSAPQVLTPSADGTAVLGNELCAVDASNTSQGYVMVDYKGDNPKPKLQITTPAGATYTYNLHGGFETFPFTDGDGPYTLTVFENLEGTQYSTSFTAPLTVTLENEFLPFLYPNQYVNFTADSKTVQKGEELAAGADTDLDVVKSVYHYVVDNIAYDYDKVDEVAVNRAYLPVVDDILAAQKGICFDYAAVMAAMLRSQNIPTRMEIGYAGEIYHAWISVYLKEQGWVDNIIQFNGSDWELMDPTFASSGKDDAGIQDFIKDSGNYHMKYKY